MEVKKIMAEKRIYSTPIIQCIKLDNEISLALQSDENPDLDPDFISVKHNFKTNPFKDTLA